MVTIPAKQILANKRILDLEIAINGSINKICEDQKYEITYAEINCAILNILKRNNGHELKTLWSNETEQQEDKTEAYPE